MSWWDDFTTFIGDAGSKTADFLGEAASGAKNMLGKLDGDTLKGTAAVASAIGQYQAAEENKRQFEQMMQLKLDDYNRSVEKQDEAQNALNTGLDNVFGVKKKKVDCLLDPTNAACTAG